MSQPPQLIAIDHDDYEAKHVGRLSHCRQFFLTTPFEPPGAKGPGAEFVAMYLFDPAGNLPQAKIDEFITIRYSMPERIAFKIVEMMLKATQNSKGGDLWS